MRLSPNTIAAIRAGIDVVAAGKPYRLFLHGSRVSDEKKGGDIDLLLLCDSITLSFFRSSKLAILMNIEKCLGEQHIDLTIASNEGSDQSDFVRLILENALPI
jgi:hypothetical protein